MAAYYNEIDPFCAQWLRNLIAAGMIAPGDVDERSIEDVRADDVRGYEQCHFFAGVGAWSYALRLAGWPDDRPVWTGSCPCQPFSGAGNGAGFDDPRHLWPVWHRLIAICRPAVVFGEQVEAAIAHGWLDLVCDDMEAAGYAVGAIGLPAACVGAPHIRQRLYWVADAGGARLQGRRRRLAPAQGRPAAPGQPAESRSAGLGGVGDTDGKRRQGQYPLLRAQKTRRNEGEAPEATRAGEVDRSSPTNGHWRATDWLACRDGKWRPVEPGTCPLADGAAARVGRLRAYGNAIVPQVASRLIRAYMDTDGDGE